MSENKTWENLKNSYTHINRNTPLGELECLAGGQPVKDENGGSAVVLKIEIIRRLKEKNVNLKLSKIPQTIRNG
ncbi:MULTISPECIES: hypothetical protein [unclassified Pedobacter]|uniref:hypothetical protein n=1 Tax=unclassified Pedobacter TaxID=2628915 RepID=UPI001BE84CEC|nr:MULTISPECIES: hypothetical protein [unclassified Pedobacter]